MTVYISLTLYIFSSIIIISFCRTKIIKWLLAAFLSTFFICQLTSLYIGDEFIDYKFFVHFNPNSLSMAGAYIWQMIFAVLLLIAVPCALFAAACTLRKFLSVSPKTGKCPISSAATKSLMAAILIATIFVLWLPEKSMYHKFREIFLFSGFSFNKKIDFDKVINDLEQKGNGIKFTPKENLQAKFGGKNIVIISLESFEMALFDDKNIDLIPNLQQLRHEWNFYAMEPQEGSHWTSGSLYTAFSGLPCFFNGTGNHIFYGAQKSKLINLGDLLKECGYETYHLSNSAKFAGTKDMLKLFGINHVLDGNFGDKSLPQLSFGGSYDADIFAKAKQILLQRNPEKPFMLWVSTTQFHTPEGAIDERMTPITGKRASALETIAVATDFLLADFLKFIENEDLMRNTVVFIMPDHLFMGHKKIFETGKPRKLWLMTNAEKTDLTIDTTNFYQIDLVKQFLAGAKIEHNAKFLTDIAKGNKDNFIKNSLSEIKTLNMSSLCKENIISESLKIIIRENILYFVVDNEIFIAKNLKLLKNKSIVIQLNNRLEILENKLVGNKKVDAFCSELPYYLRIYVENGTLNLEAAGEHCKKFSVQNCDEISLTRCETAQILGTNTPHF